VPDFLCCVDGRFFAIEAKANGGKTTALQDKNLRDIEIAGGVTCILNEDNISVLGNYLKFIKEPK
jgi:hypothetical protein